MCLIEWRYSQWPWMTPNYPKPPRFTHFESLFTCVMLCQCGTCHRCVSVRLSVTSWCFAKTVKPRIRQTTPYDSSGTLVFWLKNQNHFQETECWLNTLLHICFFALSQICSLQRKLWSTQITALNNSNPSESQVYLPLSVLDWKYKVIYWVCNTWRIRANLLLPMDV